MILEVPDLSVIEFLPLSYNFLLNLSGFRCPLSVQLGSLSNTDCLIAAKNEVVFP
jgi:hypothetical protein